LTRSINERSVISKIFFSSLRTAGLNCLDNSK